MNSAAAKKKTWIAGTAFVSVVLLAMAWFLLVSPVLATASDTREQTRTTEEQNTVLAAKVAQLKKEFEHLDEYKAELATIATQIPPSLDLAPYIRQIDELAIANEVVVIELVPQTPYLVTLAETTGNPGAGAGGAVSTEAQPAATPTPSPSASAGATGDAAAAPVPTKVEAPAGMTAVPVTMTVLGPYEKAVTFLDAIQHTTRLFLVSGMEGTTQNETAATGGRPATELGDVELKVDGFLYVMPSLAPAPDPSAEPTVKPMPQASDRNPVAPIEGSDLPRQSDDD